MTRQESLAELHGELSAVFAGLARGPVEFIFVDDGSRDRSWSVLVALSESDPRVSAIRFRRNFGKAAALTAAFQAARGDLVFTLDGDLQDDPAEIPRFLDRLEEGYDVVSGWKKTRHDPWHKVYPSRVFNWLVSRLTGCRLHDHNCGFKLYRREVLREIGIYGELHRFIPVLAHARGFRVSEVEVRHRRRRHGTSKYGVSRFIKGFLDLLTVRFLTRFRERPLHMLGGIGLSLFGLGGLGMLSLAVMWLDPANRPIGTRPLLFYSIALLLVGLQLVTLGILAELVTAYNIRAEDVYSIAERIPASESHSSPGDTDSHAPAAFLTSRFSRRPSRLLPKNQRVHGSPARRRSIDGRISSRLRHDPSHDGLTAQLVIIAATSLALGHCLRQPTQMGANDISRWCTVWSLLERGHLRHRRLPLADRDSGQGPARAQGSKRLVARQTFLFQQARAVADSDRRHSLPGTDGDGSSSRSGRSRRSA